MRGEADFPVGPVLIVDPFGVGGGPDLVARALAPALEARWGHLVTVENHPGEGSTRGPSLVARSPADGQTLLINTSAHAYSATFADQLPYRPLEDFEPVVAVSSQPYVLVAGSTAGFESFEALVAAARERPGELRFSSSGTGTGSHVGVALLNRQLEIRVSHFPAEGDAAIADTIGRIAAGRTDYGLSPISIAAPLLRDGRLVALGVSTARRSRLLPDVPTLAEVGAAGFDFPIWYGIWAPAGTPGGTLDRISADISSTIAGTDMREWLIAHDGDPMTMTRQRFARFVRDEVSLARTLGERDAGEYRRTPR